MVYEADREGIARRARITGASTVVGGDREAIGFTGSKPGDFSGRARGIDRDGGAIGGGGADRVAGDRTAAGGAWRGEGDCGFTIGRSRGNRRGCAGYGDDHVE